MAPAALALFALAGFATAASRVASDVSHTGVARHEDAPSDHWPRWARGHPTLLAATARVARETGLVGSAAGAGTGTAQALADAKPWVKSVEHEKVAGSGYVEGSPLYEKQEALEAKKTKEKQETLQAALEALAAGDLKAAWKSLPWMVMLQLFINQLIWVLLIILVACIYRMRKPQLSENGPGIAEAKDSWAYSLFDTTGMTGEDLQLCGMAFCCPAIRWADTISNPKVAFHTGLGFWKALTIVIVLAFLGPWTLYLTTLILLGILVYYRQKLRVIFNHSAGGITYPWDCFILWCCLCCTISQEAREVEKVLKPSWGASPNEGTEGFVDGTLIHPRRPPLSTPPSTLAR